MKTVFTATIALAFVLASELHADDAADCLRYYEGDEYTNAIAPCALAAEQGDVEAQFRLGVLHLVGIGVAQDFDEALRWFSAAAEQGNAMAQYSLGWMYASGDGVTQNVVVAHMWFNIASANGAGEQARQDRDLVANNMTSEQIADAQQRARQCMSSNYTDC